MAWAEGKRPSFCTSQIGQTMSTVITAAFSSRPPPLAPSPISTRPEGRAHGYKGRAAIQRAVSAASSSPLHKGCATGTLPTASSAPSHESIWRRRIGSMSCPQGDNHRPRHNAPAKFSVTSALARRRLLLHAKLRAPGSPPSRHTPTTADLDVELRKHCHV